MAKANSTRKTGNTPSAADSNRVIKAQHEHVAAEQEVFGAAISVEKVGEMEDAATTQARGQQRRIMLMVMFKGAEDLAKISEENPVVFREMRGMVQAFLPHARALAEFAQKAVTRLMVVDLREDTSKEDAEAIELLKERATA